VIRVDRRSVAAPPLLAGKEAKAALADAERHFRSHDRAAEQRLFKFRALYARPAVMEPLEELFSHKCAFCESSVGAASAPIRHHFRPKQEAVEIDGTVSRPHYWWLAYSWDNLYLTCQQCAAIAGARFPVSGPRARFGATGEELREERKLLVDPCHDEPDEHLSFADDGIVAGRTEMGAQTIEGYGLNRSSLVERRAERIRGALERLSHVDTMEQPEALEEELGPHREYTAAVRHAYVRLVERPRRPKPRRKASAKFFLGDKETASLVAAERQRPTTIVRVERIEIQDFRVIESLALQLAPPENATPGPPQAADGPDHERAFGDAPRGTAPWTMLLGENGHGKTTVLRALALALMGRAARGRAGIDVAANIRHGRPHAEIRVTVTGAIQPRVLRLDRRTGAMAMVEGDDAPALLAAYGAGRLPPPRAPRALARRYRVRPRVESLFDPHTPLMPAEQWLIDQHERDPAAFDIAARALKRLLLEEEEDTVFECHGEHVVLSRNDGHEELGQLSDGYRSMLALAADLMSHFAMRYGSFEAAEGIVLVDELGTHLHPRWQMRIVEAFKLAFPRIQFVATTHDPLCLRGLANEEVAVLRRTPDGRIFAVARDELPPLRGLRVDQLLTSEVFGLSSTVDPDLERAYNEYYALLALDDDERTQAQEDRMRQLRVTVDRHRQLGRTRREQLALTEADRFIARERGVADPVRRRELEGEAKEQIRAIWDAAGL
jgi:uncharacterized protein (TIGR02646 family)